MTQRSSLTRALLSYRATEEEKTFIPRFQELLQHADAFHRTHLPGHITGSAWVVNTLRTKALLVHHAKLNKWVQPGGHCDGEEDVLGVAIREAQEETGLVHFKPSEVIFDVDIHMIPARKDFPAHDHFDIRYLLIADENDPIAVSEESHDVKWFELDAISQFSTERSVLRMVEKTISTR